MKMEEERKTEGGAGEWRPRGAHRHAVQGARAGRDGGGEAQTEGKQINICTRWGRHCNKGGIDARIA